MKVEVAGTTKLRGFCSREPEIDFDTVSVEVLLFLLRLLNHAGNLIVGRPRATRASPGAFDVQRER